VRPLIFHWPVPGTMRTRATAFLRRPVPAAGCGSPKREASDSEVYSDSIVSTLSVVYSSTSMGVSAVVSATMLLRFSSS
jgi:hypothetical protein